MAKLRRLSGFSRAWTRRSCLQRGGTARAIPPCTMPLSTAKLNVSKYSSSSTYRTWHAVGLTRMPQWRCPQPNQRRWPNTSRPCTGARSIIQLFANQCHRQPITQRPPSSWLLKYRLSTTITSPTRSGRLVIKCSIFRLSASGCQATAPHSCTFIFITAFIGCFTRFS